MHEILLSWQNRRAVSRAPDTHSMASHVAGPRPAMVRAQLERVLSALIHIVDAVTLWLLFAVSSGFKKVSSFSLCANARVSGKDVQRSIRHQFRTGPSRIAAVPTHRSDEVMYAGHAVRARQKHKQESDTSAAAGLFFLISFASGRHFERMRSVDNLLIQASVAVMIRRNEATVSRSNP
jgi:hypothetical protein